MYEYEIATRCEHVVARYAGMSIFEVDDICYYDFRLLLRDAVIDMLGGSEAGREYLEKCWILEQDKPDRERLRARFGGEQDNGE